MHFLGDEFFDTDKRALFGSVPFFGPVTWPLKGVLIGGTREAQPRGTTGRFPLLVTSHIVECTSENLERHDLASVPQKKHVEKRPFL